MTKTSIVSYDNKKGDNMKQYDEEFIKKQKEYLEKEEKRLEKELKSTDKFPNYGDREDENAEEVEDFITAQGQEKELKTMLSEVKIALKKIEQGKYGYCENCGCKKLIDKKRLEAFPAATTCIKCDNCKS